ncbi:MAG: hypothetical protein K6F05_00170 [Succinivibrio sp.]|nr:hypothetical protein [Succinivibrio sp.]
MQDNKSSTTSPNNAINNIKVNLTILTLCIAHQKSDKGISTKELADCCGINENHIRDKIIHLNLALEELIPEAAHPLIEECKATNKNGRRSNYYRINKELDGIQLLNKITSGIHQKIICKTAASKETADFNDLTIRRRFNTYFLYNLYSDKLFLQPEFLDEFSELLNYLDQLQHRTEKTLALKHLMITTDSKQQLVLPYNLCCFKDRAFLEVLYVKNDGINTFDDELNYVRDNKFYAQIELDAITELRFREDVKAYDLPRTEFSKLCYYALALSHKDKAEQQTFLQNLANGTFKISLNADTNNLFAEQLISDKENTNSITNLSIYEFIGNINIDNIDGNTYQYNFTCTNLYSLFTWLHDKQRLVRITEPHLLVQLYRAYNHEYSEHNKERENLNRLLIIGLAESYYYDLEEDINTYPEYHDKHRADALKLVNKLQCKLSSNEFNNSAAFVNNLEEFSTECSVLMLFAQAVREREHLLVRLKHEKDYSFFYPLTLTYAESEQDTQVTGFKLITEKDAHKEQIKLQQTKFYFKNLSSVLSLYDTDTEMYLEIPATLGAEAEKILLRSGFENFPRPAEDYYLKASKDKLFTALLHQEEEFTLLIDEKDCKVIFLPDFIRIKQIRYKIYAEDLNTGQSRAEKRKVYLKGACTEHHKLLQWLLEEADKVKLCDNEYLLHELKEKIIKLNKAYAT